MSMESLHFTVSQIACILNMQTLTDKLCISQSLLVLLVQGVGLVLNLQMLTTGCGIRGASIQAHYHSLKGSTKSFLYKELNLCCMCNYLHVLSVPKYLLLLCTEVAFNCTVINP